MSALSAAQTLEVMRSIRELETNALRVLSTILVRKRPSEAPYSRYQGIGDHAPPDVGNGSVDEHD